MGMPAAAMTHEFGIGWEGMWKCGEEVDMVMSGRDVAAAVGNMVTCTGSALAPTSPVADPVSVHACLLDAATSGTAYAMSALIGSVFGMLCVTASPRGVCKG